MVQAADPRGNAARAAVRAPRRAGDEFALSDRMTRLHWNRARRFGRLSLALALAAAACSGMRRRGPGAPEPSLPTERYELTGSAVSVYDPAGEVRVEPVPSGDVVVTVTRVGTEAERLHVQVDRRSGGDALRVTADTRRLFYPGLAGSSDSVEFRGGAGGYRPGRGGFLGLFAGRSMKVVRRPGAGGTVAHADVVVSLPPGRRLDVHVGAGQLRIGRVAGEVHGSTVGGATEADAPAGRVFLSATSGGISATGGEGELTLSAPRGAVDVTGFAGARLAVTTGAGSITLADVGANALDASAGAGDVSLDRVRAHRVEIRAGAGELRVREVTADSLVARSGVGAVSLLGVRAGWATVKAGKGDADVGLASVPAMLHVEADGAAVLGLPAGADAELLLRTDHGRLRLDYPADVRERTPKRLVARLGRGGRNLEVKAEHDIMVRETAPAVTER